LVFCEMTLQAILFVPYRFFKYSLKFLIIPEPTFQALHSRVGSWGRLLW
jgi:hypothetical protein